MNILVACEESQVVCKAFRDLGFEAFSCDIQECSGGHPEWHIQGDALVEAYSGKYTLMVGHPPCTYISRAGARWMHPTAGNISEDRLKLAKEAKEFFDKLMDAPIPHIALENPTPLKVVGMSPHTQVIQPYHFGHPYSKRTLLWLKNLPDLKFTNVVGEYTPFLPSNTGGKKRGQSYSRGVAKTAKESSVTFKGVAEAMASQWGNYIKNYHLY